VPLCDRVSERVFVSSAAGLHNAFATPSTIIYIYVYKAKALVERERAGERDIVKCMRRRLLRRTNEINVCVCVCVELGRNKARIAKDKVLAKKKKKKKTFLFLSGRCVYTCSSLFFYGRSMCSLSPSNMLTFRWTNMNRFSFLFLFI
jgi:hypothetical protein